MSAKQQQLIPLGLHQCHLVIRVLGARPLAAGWAQLGQPDPPSFPLGLATHTRPRHQPCPPSQCSSRKALTSAGQTQVPVPARPLPCDQDLGQARRRLSCMRTAQPPGQPRGRNDATAAALLLRGRGQSWLKNQQREQDARPQPGSPHPHPHPHRGPALDRPVPAALEISFTRTTHQRHKCP